MNKHNINNGEADHMNTQYYLADEVDKELAALRSEIANYETARQEDARRMEQLQSENRFLSGVISGMENAENEKLEQVKGERDAYKRIIEDVRAGNYDNANDSLAARKFIYKELAALKDAK